MESGTVWSEMTGTVWSEMGGTVWSVIATWCTSFSSLGLKREKFQIQVYDFLAHGIYSNYNGILGLDFFEGTKFCIDLNENVITLYTP